MPTGAAGEVVTSIPPLMALAAAVCVVCLGCLLWKSRVQYVDAEGRRLTDEIPTVEPPAEADRERCRRVSGAWAAIAGVCYLLFLMSSSLAAAVVICAVGNPGIKTKKAAAGLFASPPFDRMEQTPHSRN